MDFLAQGRLVVLRGEVWWADLPDPVGSAPGYTRPVVIVQSDEFSESGINTVIVVALTTNLRLANAPGNVLLERTDSSLPRDSVINVSQLLTIDKTLLVERVGILSDTIMAFVEAGLLQILGLYPTEEETRRD